MEYIPARTPASIALIRQEVALQGLAVASEKEVQSALSAICRNIVRRCPPKPAVQARVRNGPRSKLETSSWSLAALPGVHVPGNPQHRVRALSAIERMYSGFFGVYVNRLTAGLVIESGTPPVRTIFTLDSDTIARCNGDTHLTTRQKRLTIIGPETSSSYQSPEELRDDMARAYSGTLAVTGLMVDCLEATCKTGYVNHRAASLLREWRSVAATPQGAIAPELLPYLPPYLADAAQTPGAVYRARSAS